MKRKLTVITCPKCGKEYLPAEIFIPKAFFGIPEIIQRDANGKIISFSGTSLDSNEHYCCDKCDTEFEITSKISFDTYVNEEFDFDNDYQRKINTGLTLKEF